MEKIAELIKKLETISSTKDIVMARAKGHAGLSAQDKEEYEQLEAEYQKVVGQYEDVAAAEIVRQHEAIAEAEKTYKELKKVYAGISTRKIVPVKDKVVEIKLVVSYEKVDFEKANEKFSINQLVKAKAVSISAAEGVRTALGMLDEAATKSLFKVKSTNPSVTVRKG